MSLGHRIAKIKALPVLDSFLASAPEGFEEPEHLPQHVLCLLPDHEEKTPSFWLQEHRWYCFGCQRGGDVLDFVQELHGVNLPTAVRLAEAELGLEEEEDELAVLVARARAQETSPGGPRPKDWEAAVGHVEREFFDSVRPFLRCRDPLVSELAWSRAEYVFSELDDATAGDRPPPVTDRRFRQDARALSGFAWGWALDLARDVLRLTGKDRLDVASQPA